MILYSRSTTPSSPAHKWRNRFYLSVFLGVVRDELEGWCNTQACFWWGQFVRRYLEQRAADVDSTAEYLP